MSLTPAQLSQYQALLAAAAASPSPHLSFKAGLVDLKDGTATPDTRRGTVRLLTTDSLLHLQWLTRPGDSVDVDLLLFAGSADWAKVEECRDGRVYALKYKDSSKKQLFWLQEPLADKDAELSERINALINQPPDEQTPMALGAGAGAGAARSVAATSAVQATTRNAPAATASAAPPATASDASQANSGQNQSQMHRLLQALASAAATANISSGGSSSSSGGGVSASAAASSAASSSVDTAALTRSLAGVVAQLSRSDATGGGGGGPGMQLPPHSLLDVLQSDRLLPLLSDDDRRELVRLLPGENEPSGSTASATPSTTDSAISLSASLSRHLRSAQFAQTAGRMQSLLYSENYGSLLSSLGLDTSAGGFGVEGLVAAIERKVRLDREKQAATNKQQQQPPPQPQ